MKLLPWLSSLFRSSLKVDNPFPFSIVLLLRQPYFFTDEELRAAGERGWRKRFDGVEDPMYFVVQKGGVTFVKAGKNVFHVLHSPQPYGDAFGTDASQLPQPEQRKAWRNHTAWASVDNWNKDLGKVEAYAAVTTLVRHLADGNCLGVYLPEQQMLMPNDGTADQGLQFIIDGELPFR